MEKVEYERPGYRYGPHLSIQNVQGVWRGTPWRSLEVKPSTVAGLIVEGEKARDSPGPWVRGALGWVIGVQGVSCIAEVHWCRVDQDLQEPVGEAGLGHGYSLGGLAGGHGGRHGSKTGGSEAGLKTNPKII